MSGRWTACTRARTMYMTTYVRANHAMYMVIYVRARRVVRVHAMSGKIALKSHCEIYLRRFFTKRPLAQKPNLVPHSPAIVPQSKCLTAGLTGVTAQGLTLLVPQCPAMFPYLYMYAGARAHTRTRTPAHGGAMGCTAGLCGTTGYDLYTRSYHVRTHVEVFVTLRAGHVATLSWTRRRTSPARCQLKSRESRKARQCEHGGTQTAPDGADCTVANLIQIRQSNAPRGLSVAHNATAILAVSIGTPPEFSAFPPAGSTGQPRHSWL